MSIYNEDELVPPEWINQEFLEQVLRQYEICENIEIIDFTVSPASLKGDHYASVMFRLKVSYTSGGSSDITEKSLILKTLPTEEGFKRDLLKESKLFETEISMYAEALPNIEKILADCGEPTKLAAEIIYYSLEPHKLLIFEDLCEIGYSTLRERYLTEEEIKVIYRKIAKLHAVSYILGHSEDHEIVTKYDKGIFCNSTIMAMDMMTQGLGNFIKMLENHEEFAVYLEKIRAMKEDINENCKKLYNAYKLEQSESDIFVLNHGDFHMKNMMFKLNSSNEVEDVIMVDYQISCYAPSIIDMVYSQYMLLSPELRLRKNDLMYFYFEEFIRILKKLNYEGGLPKYSDFQITNLKYRHFSIFLLATFLPLVRGILVLTPDQLKDVDTTKFVESPEMAAAAYQNPELVEEMRTLLPKLLTEGYLD